MTKGDKDTMFEMIVNYICDGDKANTSGFNRLLRCVVTTGLINRLMEIAE